MNVLSGADFNQEASKTYPNMGRITVRKTAPMATAQQIMNNIVFIAVSPSSTLPNE
jgi:hypothetical protein